MKTKKTVFSLLFACIAISSFAQDTIQLKAYVENMKTIDVFIEGKKYNFLFDTGGADTFISPEIAKSLNKEIYGCITGFRMSGEIIKAKKANDIALIIGKTNLFHKTVSVWDLMSILPKDFKGGTGAAAIKISPDGQFLYVSDRVDANNISVFKILRSGGLELQEQVSTLGKGPRDFSIDPTGNFLLVGHQYTNSIVVFKRDKATGKLTDTGKRIELCAPVCLVFN